MEVITSLKSKADALVFAINKVTEGAGFDKQKVDEIYDYILSKVSFPDVETDASAGYLDVLNGMMSRYVEMISQIQDKS